jgi:hypothetical protein
MGKRKQRRAILAKTRKLKRSDRSRNEGYLEMLLWALKRRSLIHDED